MLFHNCELKGVSIVGRVLLPCVKSQAFSLPPLHSCSLVRLLLRSSLSSQKGGDPAALSSTATLLRLHPPYQAYLRRRLPYG